MRTRALACSLVVLAVAPRALAREAPAVDDDDDDGVEGLADEALGPRGNLRTRAESVSFDARERTLELSGNVRVDAPPFHLRSQRITLTRTRYGIEIEGRGRLAFCPCLGTPLTVEFDKAIVAPPGDLVLKSPRLELYGVPVMALPWFWLRSDEKVGVLPPDLAYRGQDGVFVGEGVHVPWKNGVARHALDVRAGAYVLRGFATDARLRTPISTTRVRYDRLPGATSPVLPVPGVAADREGDDGLFVDARGAATRDELTTAWDADVIRGRRGVAATTELDAAAKPWDRAAVEGAVRAGPIVASTGVRAVSRRGGGLVDVESAGPVASVRASGAVGAWVAYDVTLEGGALRVTGPAASVTAAAQSLGAESVSFARAEAGALGATTLGPFAASVSARGSANAAVETGRDGGDRAATARARLGLPLARRFDPSPEADGTLDRDAVADPWVHAVEPFVEASVLHARGDAILGSLPGRALAAISGTAPVTDAGITSTLGRWGRKQALDVRVAAGAAYGEEGAGADVRPLVRGRMGATLAWLGASADTAHVLGSSTLAGGGSVVVGRVRIGSETGPRVHANLASRVGIDPVLARTLTDAPLEPPAGFLSREGTTGGAALVLPWSRWLVTSIGADGDATNQDLVGARGGFELRDRCGCVTLRGNASHRIGRRGVDVWLAIDFATNR